MQWPSMLSSSSSQQGVRKNQFISGHTPRFLPLFACRCYNSGSGSIPISCWNKRSDARPLGQHPDITLAIRPTNTNKQPQNKFASAAGLDGSLRKFTSGPPGHFANEQPDIERWKLSRTPGHWQTTSLQSDQFGSQPSQFICSVNRRAKVHFISLMKLFLRSITPRFRLTSSESSPLTSVTQAQALSLISFSAHLLVVTAELLMLVSIQRLSKCVSAVLFCHLGSGSQHDPVWCFEMLDYRGYNCFKMIRSKASLKQTHWHGWQQSKSAMNN